MKLEKIEIGRIVNAHGIRGEVRVLPKNQKPEFLTRFHTFYLDGQAVNPTANHVHKNFVLLKLPGVDDMNAALALKEKRLFIRREDAHLAPGEAFDEELPGVEVRSADTGEMLGTLTLVETYPASKVYTVKGEKTYLIPAVPEVFIQSLDLDRNLMEVHVLKGMADDEN